ncbi:endonuclease [Clostridioides difficile]|nr:endonuclease [Clostridioides difficile]
MTSSEKKIIVIMTIYVGFNLLDFSVKGFPVEELRFKIINKKIM